MPNFSGMWSLKEQAAAVAAGTWTGISLFELYMWGSNQCGNFGLNNTTNYSSPVQVGLESWSEVSTSGGGSHTVAIKPDGTLWTWGSNADGKLGDDTTVNKSSPIQIGLETWSKVSNSIFHTTAIRTDGTMWSWGRGTYALLGIGGGPYTFTSRSSPTQIGALTTWSKVNVGDRNGFAIKTDGTLWGWGSNAAGQMGLGTRCNNPCPNPCQVGALTTWELVTVGTDGSCSHIHAIKTDGTLWGWGANRLGQLGDGTNNARCSPVQIGALTDWAQVNAGCTLAFAVKTNGTLWGWGYNERGELGINSANPNPPIFCTSPIQIGALTNWSQVSAAGSSGGMAVKTDGTLWGWGSNTAGFIGDGYASVRRSSPVQVGSSTCWTCVEAANNAVAALFEGKTN